MLILSDFTFFDIIELPAQNKKTSFELLIQLFINFEISKNKNSFLFTNFSLESLFFLKYSSLD